MQCLDGIPAGVMNVVGVGEVLIFAKLGADHVSHLITVHTMRLRHYAGGSQAGSASASALTQ